MRDQIWGSKIGPVTSGLSLAALLAFGSCGDDSSNPKEESIEGLNPPSGFMIRDLGNGSIELSWDVTNDPEEDEYDGFNIYGVRLDAADIGLSEGSSLKLLNEAGDPVDEAKGALQKMNFSLETPFEASDESPVDEDGNKTFAFYPIYAEVDEDSKPILPTCQPDGDGVCTRVEAEVEELTEEVKAATLGTRITYQLGKADGIKIGENHCFLILTSTDAGEGVSGVSSEARCITPNFKVDLEVNFAGMTLTDVGNDKSGKVALDKAYLEACAEEQACAAPTAASQEAIVSSANPAAGPLFVEHYNGVMYLVAGAKAAINQFGPASSLGLDDPGLYIAGSRRRLQGPITKDLINEGGFSLPGQSITMIDNMVYILAVEAEDGKGYYEHLLWIKDEPSDTAAFTIEARISTNVISY